MAVLKQWPSYSPLRRLVAASAVLLVLLVLRRRRGRKSLPVCKPLEYEAVLRPRQATSCSQAYMVTGGAGMLGGRILAQLRQQYPDAKLLSLDLGVPPTSRRVQAVIYLRCDLTNPEHLALAFAEAHAGNTSIAAVLHVAAALPTAQTTWNIFERVNVHATIALLQKSLEASAASFIYCSSATVVLDLNKPVMEGIAGEALPYPDEYVDLYARSKALGEMEVLQRNGELNASGMPLVTCALRISGVVDANDKAMGQNLPHGKNNAYFGAGRNVLDWVWSVDVAWCFMAATKAVVSQPGHVGGRVFHVGGFNAALTLKDWVSFPDPEHDGQTLWGNRMPPMPVPAWAIRCGAILNCWGIEIFGFPPINPMLRPDTIRVTDGTLSWWWDLSAAKQAFAYEPTPVAKVIGVVRDEALGHLDWMQAASYRQPPAVQS